MKKSSTLRILITLSLIFAFAVPASAESVTNNVYDVPEPEPVVVGTIDVKVTAGDAQLTVSVAKQTSERVAPDTYKVSVQKKGDTKVAVSKEWKADSLSYTFKQLANTVEYSITVVGLKGGQVVGNGSGTGIPTALVAVLSGVRASAGDGQAQLTFNKLSAKLAANYIIEWWSTNEQGKQVKGKTVVIKASQLKKNSYTQDFKKLKNGITYHFTVSVEAGNKAKLAVSQDVTATPKAKFKK